MRVRVISAKRATSSNSRFGCCRIAISLTAAGINEPLHGYRPAARDEQKNAPFLGKA
jgi:hypothetical protein